MRRTVALIVSLGLTLAMTALAGAAPLTWNTCEGGSDNLCSPQNAPANSVPESPRTSSGTGINRIYTFEAIGDPGKLLGVRAFRSTTTVGTGVVEKREINLFSGGLGAGPEGSPQHAVDNLGPDEFLVFRLFSDDAIPVSFSIGWRDNDADISTWIGGTQGGSDDALTLLLSGSFPWSPSGGALTATHGYVQQDFLNVASSVTQLFTNDARGRYLIIGARHEATPAGGDDGEDTFKILEVVADEDHVVVPLPGTLLLVGSGVASLAWIRYRRRR